ncbi:MAG: ABC transporter ATP-binding protein [Candidatus Methanomethylophilus sp.]|nr:ABC transporter ATP-binding protein [Methanomethylophilus sp.]
MSEPVLQTQNVKFKYERNAPVVLDDVSVSISRNVKTAILGANGAGKSTLFSILNALRRPDSGEVLYNGSPLSYRKKDIRRMRSEVSILFQNPNDMLFRPIVEQDVAYGPENMKLPKDEVQKRVDDALFAVGMSEFRKSPTMKLSYGQRKRITLAGVLAMKPEVLIMDEPTAGLDPQMACEVMEIAEQLHRSGVTVIMSSHDTNLTYSWADEIHVMRHGRCVYSGPAEPFYSDKVEVYLSGLMPPMAFVMNEGLSSCGTVEREPFPHTQCQMSAKIGNSKVSAGTLHIIPVEDGSDINALIADNGFGDMTTGIYGMSARRAQDASKARIDFVYNGPENCTLKCLSGNDAVLFCDPVMIESARASADFISKGGFADISLDIRS